MIKLIRAAPESDTDMIFEGKRFVGIVGRRKPVIQLEHDITQQTLERIKNVVNKRDNTNKDIPVRNPPPSLDHPAVQRYLRRRYGY